MVSDQVEVGDVIGVEFDCGAVKLVDRAFAYEKLEVTLVA
ncbi:hypothetical protein CDAR_233581, partial [Caerostris darwini]